MTMNAHPERRVPHWEAAKCGHALSDYKSWTNDYGTYAGWDCTCGWTWPPIDNQDTNESHIDAWESHVIQSVAEAERRRQIAASNLGLDI